jgi:hypothetical protein
VQTVKLYPSLVATRPRLTFFFSDCMQEGFYGIGRWYCDCLAERPSWRRYPAEKWFVTKKGAQMWAPLGKVYMDYTDQEVYSYCSGMMPGSEWISDKAKFATCLKDKGGVKGLRFLPTWYIHKNEWSVAPKAEGDWDETPAGLGPQHAPPVELAEALDGRIWFLKETNRNYAAGTFVKGSVADCLADAEMERNYVVQPHYADPMLITRAKKKFHTRIYLFAHSPAGKTHVEFYMYDIGALSIATKGWEPGSQDRDVQITRDRTMRFEDWVYFEEVMALYTAVSESVLSHIVGQNRLHPTAKASYELFGIDYAMTADWGVVCYEINSGPCMKPENRPMLHDMLDIVLPFGYDPQRCAVCRAAPRRGLSQWPCAGSTPKATRASAAGSSSTRPPSARRKRCACAPVRVVESEFP